MTRTILLALGLAAAPLAAAAFPEIGDIVGTNPTDASVALREKGCDVTEFDTDDGQIEAKCVDPATSKRMEVHIDPKTGAVTNIKLDD